MRLLPIGNYIHYHLERYRCFGISMATTGRGTGMAVDGGREGEYEGIQAFKDQRQKIKERASNITRKNVELQAIENKLNFFMSSKDYSKKMQNVKNYIEDTYGMNISDAELKYGRVESNLAASTQKNIATINEVFSGNSTLMRGGKSGKDSYLNVNSIAPEVGAQNIYLATIVGRVKLIRNMLNMQVIQSGNKLKINQMLDSVTDIMKQILGDKYTKDLFETPDCPPEFKNCLISLEDIKNTPAKDKSNLITLINSLLKNPEIFPRNRAKEAQGAMGELIALIALTGCDIAAQEAADKAVGSIKANDWKGQMVGRKYQREVAFDRQFFDNKAIWTNFYATKKITYGENGGTQKVITKKGFEAQGKVDIEVEYKSGYLPISVKNYTLAAQRDISLVSGTGLLFLLQDEFSDYVNHYLNVIAYHQDTGYGSELREQAYLATAYTVLYKAITGDVYGHFGDDVAEIFVVHDASKDTAGYTNQGWKVYSISGLLYNILQSAESLSRYATIDIDNAYHGNKLENIAVLNPWESGKTKGGDDAKNFHLARIRIGKYLTNVAEVKLHAALKPAALTINHK